MHKCAPSWRLILIVDLTGVEKGCYYFSDECVHVYILI